MLHKIIALGMFALLLSACAGASKPATEITLELTDFSYTPSSLTIPVDQPVLLTINNTGLVEHDFVVEKIDVTDVVAQDSGSEHHMQGMEEGASYDLHVATGAGQTNTLQFTALEPGTYKIFCSVQGHIEAGMIGELIVVSE
ncbi:MAG: cupredoxin domain-containing protein [Anaerolineales bacterium]|nr:cupredoxin domain-containing protein [Anaerolineales bacterium]